MLLSFGHPAFFGWFRFPSKNTVPHSLNLTYRGGCLSRKPAPEAEGSAAGPAEPELYEKSSLLITKFRLILVRPQRTFMRLYETHLPVKDTEASRRFYVNIVGLEFAYRDPGRDVVFLWIGTGRNSMLGLWGPTTVHGRKTDRCHFAIAVPLPDLLVAGERLNRLGITTCNFAGEETTEPSVIGWMPSAQLYFRDPDNHSLEFIALLDDAPDSRFIGPLSAWRTLSLRR
jgi:lactoylglutathione lyase